MLAKTETEDTVQPGGGSVKLKAMFCQMPWVLRGLVDLHNIKFNGSNGSKIRVKYEHCSTSIVLNTIDPDSSITI